MKIPALPQCHLSYCTNIHRGDSWSEIQPCLAESLPKIKSTVCPNDAMGIGLRLSALAATELSIDLDALAEFKEWMSREDFYVYTINGFPYSTFYDEPVKEDVYQPDWCSEERLDYTKNLAILLAEFLPEGQHGSISTVPLGFKQNFNDESRVAEAAQMLLQYIAFAMEVEAHSGKVIQLALEPEPGCYLETTQGCIDFFTHHIFTKDSLNFLSTQVNDPASATFDRMRRYLGVCLDTCHAAVMFERPLLMAMALKEARIPIHKIQLTAALKQKDFSASSKEYLSPFAEEVYLHQSCVQNTATKSLDFYLDLPEALENASPGSELRTHFHVPVFVEDLGEIQTTQEELKELLSGFSENCWSTHLEVETYTFNVLPDSLRGGSIEENISREIQWVVDNLQ